MTTIPIRTLLAGAAIGFALAGAAGAHSKNEETTPADGATVPNVETIEMRFDMPMRVTTVTLSGEAGEVAVERETGMERVTAFRAAPVEALAPGTYAVEWRGLSADGHPMQGTFGFTVAP